MRRRGGHQRVFKMDRAKKDFSKLIIKKKEKTLFLSSPPAVPR
jgi:hypothetical protein|tara:strand:+ start:263 stop:391 length:129 start_codon:yes stop_codon:yes gene_type:complete